MAVGAGLQRGVKRLCARRAVGTFERSPPMAAFGVFEGPARPCCRPELGAVQPSCLQHPEASAQCPVPRHRSPRRAGPFEPACGVYVYRAYLH
ncbi:hypothetical protein C2E23DRAFT_823514 [Lenzites betulinus]|nr:hypothetical protein C2E23DRAFT_855176 [Lenzites betulinus]KAH9853173.1 hypothetical protein C2E23DRAFT_823514 [Lenzites betulinus]